MRKGDEDAVGVSSIVGEEQVSSDTEVGEEESGVGDDFGESPSEGEEKTPTFDVENEGFLQWVRNGYRKDPKWRGLLTFLLDPESEELSQLERAQMGYRANHFVQRDGLIYLKGYYRHNAKDARVALERLVLPDSLRTWVVSQLHDSPTACHLGRNRVVASLKRRFYFPNIDQVVQRYTRTCARCQKSKAQKDRRAGLLKSKEFFTPGMLGVDLQGPFP